MSAVWTAIVVMLALGLLFVAGIEIWVARRLRHRPEPVAPAPQPESEPQDDLSEEEARVVDPEHPPFYSRYKVAGYDRASAPVCSCHKRKVEPGERVLVWPIPNHPDGAVDLFCAETYTQVRAG